MEKLDPIKDGLKIFKNIYKSIGKDSITDLREFDNFLKLLLEQTKGWIIVDFLDAGNWDSVETYSIDYEKGLVYLNWYDHRNRSESDDNKTMWSMAFPEHVHGLCFQFQELKLINIRDITLYTIRGYALSTKEVEKIMSQGASELEIFDDTNNFSIALARRVDGQVHVYTFLNTPIFSTLILPKSLRIRSFQSKGFLFAYNLWLSNERISVVQNDLTKGKITKDEISEKANTLRRIMEGILKVECCYRSQQIKVKKSYSDMVLGDLVKLIRDFRNDEEKKQLNTIVRIANELSHDSGKPVTLEKAIELCGLVKKYCGVLDLEIQTNPIPHYNW